MREAVGDGIVLKHSRDPGLDGLRHILPDWNLRNITTTPEFFLDRLKFRVETDLQRQHFEGANGGPGDREIVKAAAQSIRPARNGEFAVFVSDENYGR